LLYIVALDSWLYIVKVLRHRLVRICVQLANATQDEDAVKDALEDAQDHWAPPDGFTS
jgi:hypothetical protein